MDSTQSIDELMLDPQPLEDLRLLEQSGAPGLTEKLIGLFFKNTEELLPALLRGVEANDLKTVARAAHTIKSIAPTLGANRLSSLCKALEIAAREESARDYGALIDRVQSEYVCVRDSLERALTEGRQQRPPG